MHPSLDERRNNFGTLQILSKREIDTSTASLHDSQVDLSIEDEVVLRDRGYFGAKGQGG